MMGAFYYCLTDDNGVQCIEQAGAHTGSDRQMITEEEMASLAESYPDVIYFHHWAAAPMISPGARV